MNYEKKNKRHQNLFGWMFEKSNVDCLRPLDLFLFTYHDYE